MLYKRMYVNTVRALKLNWHTVILEATIGNGFYFLGHFVEYRRIDTISVCTS